MTTLMLISCWVPRRRQTMPRYSCPVPGCKYSTEVIKAALATILFKIHGEAAHSTRSKRPAKFESVRDPNVCMGGTSEERSPTL